MDGNGSELCINIFIKRMCQVSQPFNGGIQPITVNFDSDFSNFQLYKRKYNNKSQFSCYDQFVINKIKGSKIEPIL